MAKWMRGKAAKWMRGKRLGKLCYCSSDRSIQKTNLVKFPSSTGRSGSCLQQSQSSEIRMMLAEGRASFRFWRVQQKLVPIWSWGLPIFFILSCIALKNFSQPVRAYMPVSESPWLLGGYSNVSQTSTAKFSLPSNKSASYSLGYSFGVISQSLRNDETAIQLAANILGLPESSITKTLIKEVGEAIEDNDNNGIGARIRGLFSFVSFIWCIAIVGVSASLLPVAKMIIEEVVKFLRQAPRVLQFLKDTAEVVRPVCQGASFWVCFYIIVSAGRYPQEYNYFIALSGCLLSVPVFIWIASSSHSDKSDLLKFFLSLFMSLVMAPIALEYNSSLLGFLSIGAFFQALGLSAVPVGLGWYVGFSDDRELYQVSCTSSLILFALISAKIFRADSSTLHIFHAGLSVFGPIGLFLAGLIDTSRWYRSRSRFWAKNAGFLVILLLSVLAGSVFELASVKNSAITFFILWAIEKILEWAEGRWFWVAIFCSSLLFWQFALWLHTHPDFVQSFLF